MNTTVSCELHLRLVVSSESSLPVPAGLRYDTADPYAVHAAFHTGAGWHQQYGGRIASRRKYSANLC